MDYFIFFYSLIVVAKTSKTLLNTSGEGRHPYLVSDFRGNAFNFSLLSIMFAMCLSYMAFILLMYAPFMPTLRRVFYFFLIINVC